jgi:beta-ureidopropionase / N-carbamoyl-L-amino-acid hydrolase
MSSAHLTLDELNHCSVEEFVQKLEGIYEHSPWIPRQGASHRPFSSLAALKQGLIDVVDHADQNQQLQLLRAHPELAGKAMVAKTLTLESTGEQSTAGLTHCSPDQFQQLQSLNQQYNKKFGFPFILAVRGPRGTGLSREVIISTFARRLDNHPNFELAECLRNVHRIAEIRLNDKFNFSPVAGHWIWDAAEDLARYSDPGYKERGELTVTYLTEAHQACAQRLRELMTDCGFDEVAIDDVGNVVGVYHADQTAQGRTKTLLTGSHYDTVRNAGKYDGRLGILVPMAVVRHLKQHGKRLAFDLEVVGFAEEEGQRYKATFLGSGALTGNFDPSWLEQLDDQGVSMRQALWKCILSKALF